MLAVYRTLEKVLDNPTTVLVEGESCTGKDALIQWLHFNGSRKDGPYIKVDFSSLPEELVQSELFGFGRGVFTCAVSAKLGMLDMAHCGRVVLVAVASVALS